MPPLRSARLPLLRHVATLVAAVLLLAGTPLIIMLATSSPALAGTNDYPAKWRDAAQDSQFDTWGNYNRECTSFVGWRLAQHGLPQPWRGENARRWGPLAREHGLRVDTSPAVGSVAWRSSGHVAWVEVVNNQNGTVLVEDYNSDWHRFTVSRVALVSKTLPPGTCTPTPPGQNSA